MTKRRRFLYPFNFFFNQNDNILFNTLIVGFDGLFEVIGSIPICEIGYNRNRLICFHLCKNFCTIHNNFSVENLLVDAFIEVVRYCPNEHTLGEVGNLTCRDKAIHLCGNGSGFVVSVDSHGLPLLKHLAETFRESLGSFTYDLPTEHVAHGVLYYLALLVAIIPC